PFNVPPLTPIYTLSLHDALPISAIAFATIGHHFTLESDGAHGHCRAPLTAGWPHQFASGRAKHRRARFDDSDRERRIDQLASAQDRKSTRLNSSHVAISYAVFCL